MSQRERHLLAAAGLGVLLAGCQGQVAGALAVRLHLEPGVLADCLKVTALDGATPVRWAVLPRAAGKADYLVAVARTQDMPATIGLEATGWLGSCADEAHLLLNARGPTATATFPASEVLEVPLSLGPPTGELDADRDGYVAAAKGGGDCDDADPAIHPGATQDCASRVDANCDGQVACDDPTCASAAVCAFPPDRLTLTGAPAAATTGQCVGPVTVGLAAAGGARSAIRDTAVTLTASAGSAVFGLAGCGGPALGQVAIPFLGTIAQVWLRLGPAGPATLEAAAAGLASASAQVAVQPTAVTALALSGVPGTLRAGECSAPLTVTLQGAGGPTTVPTGSTFTVTLGAQPQDVGGNFFPTPDCAGPGLGQLSIPAGQGAASFRVRATRTPTVTLAASGAGLSTQASVAVSAGPATEVAFLNQPLGLRTADACSTARGALLQLVTQDQFHNQAPAGSTLRLALSSTAPPLVFHQPDAGASPCAVTVSEVSIPQGSSRADVALTVASTGAGTVTATPNQAGVAPVSQPYSVAAGDPVRLAFTSLPQAPLAGQCTQADLVLEARDSAGTPSSFAADLPVRLTRTSGVADPRFAFYGQPGCPGGSALVGGALTFPAGQSQAHFFFRGEKAATFSVGAAPVSGPVLGDSSAGNAVRAGPPAALAWTPPATASAVAGACAAPWTLQVLDGYANATSFGSATSLLVSATGPAPGATFGLAAGQCQTAQPFTLDAGVQALAVAGRAPASGTYAVSATAGGVSTAAAATLTVTPGTGILAVSPSGTVAVTAGACLQLQYSLADALGNPVLAGAGGDTLALGPLPAGVSAFATLADCSAASSAAAAFPVAPGASGRLVWVRGTAASATAAAVPATLAGSTASMSLLVSPDLAASLAFLGLPASQQSGLCSAPLSLSRKDRFGNPAVAGPASAQVSGGALGYTASPDCSGSSGPSASVSFAAGASVSSAFTVLGTVAGASAVTADAGTLSTTGTFTVTAGPPASVRWTSSPGAAVAGVCAGPLTLQVRDGAGNPTAATNLAVDLSASPAPVAFFGDGACGAALDGGFLLTGAGATLSFRARGAPALETLTAASAALASSDFQVWPVSLGPPSAVAWTVPPPATLARSTCSNAASVQLQDLGGNPAPAAAPVTVTLASASPDAGLAFYLDPGCLAPVASVDVAAGDAGASVYLAAVGSGSTVVTAGGGGLLTSPGQSVAVAGPPGVLTAAAPQADLEAGGCLALTITRDAGLQPGVGVTPLAFGVSDAGLTVHGDATCALPALTRGAIAEGSTSTTVYLRGRSVPAPFSTLDVSVSDATQGCLPATLTVRTYPLVRRGSCDIPANGAVSSCNLGLPSDDLSRTLLVFQSTSTATTGANGLVECHLVVPDAGLSCSRQAAPNFAASVQWQTVSWGRGADDGGLTVQHLSGALLTTAPQSVARGPADLSRAFVLFSASSNNATSSRVEDFGIARLTDDGGVALVRSVESGALPTGDYALQVVEVGGARVDRGSATGGAVAGLGVSCALPAPATSRLSVLLSARVAAGGTTNDICSYGFRGALTGGTLALHRGGVAAGGTCVGLAIPEVAYEFIEWPPGTVVDRPGSAADAGAVDLALNALSGTWVPALGASAHRTLLYHPTQGPGGQSWGESDHTQMDLGAPAGLLTLSSGTVTVTRGQAAGAPNAARFTPIAVTFDP